MSKLPDSKFSDFGESVVSKVARRPIQQIGLPADRLQARQLVRERCPALPGIYGWLDQNSQLLYVGKSKSLRTRLLTYFAKTPTDQKMARIRARSSRLVWEPVCHELLALMREQEMIYRWRPSFNRQGKPEQRKPGFVCIGGGVAPTAFFAYTVTPRAAFHYGPVTGTTRLRAAVESLNYAFRLRDCSDRTPMAVTNQLTLFDADETTAKCIRYELQSCLGPCVNSCSTNEYQSLLTKATSYLNGEDDSIVRSLEDQMYEYAGRGVYERASVLKNQWQSLRWLTRGRLAALNTSRNRLTGVYPVPGLEQPTVWIVLRQGSVVGYIENPFDSSASKQNRKTLRAAMTGRAEVLSDPLAIELFLIVNSWFRKFPEELSRVIPVEKALRYAGKHPGPLLAMQPA